MNALRMFARRPATPLMVWLLLCGLTFLAAITESMTVKVVSVATMAPIVLGLVLLAFWRIAATAAYVGAKIGTVPPGQLGGADTPNQE